jgi:cobalt-precorrin 5A hydrolase / precorrin-3B C17-methyltransferase
VSNKTVIVVLHQLGLNCAERIKVFMPEARIHGLAGRVTDGADETFMGATDHLRELFRGGHTIIGICAAGILVRALSSVLDDKHTEPPVLAVAGDGSSIVPLLGGHHGANALAIELANQLGGTAAITTAGDVQLGFALDEPPSGWHVQNPENAKDVAAALLADDPVVLAVEAGNADWIGATFSDEAELSIRVTDKLVEAKGRALVFNPPSLALGVGCERGANTAELIELVEHTLADEGLTTRSIACVVSIDLKADEDAVHGLAAHLGVEARFYSAEELEQEAGRLVNPSDIVFHETGCHGVAEGAALAAVGTSGDLITPKHKSKRATCAVARADGNLDVATVGRPQGSLAIVGIGPGSEEWRTPQVTRALSQADHVVGYGLYLDLVKDVIAGKERHQSDLAQEEARARAALELAAEGKRAALVCSGDAGIYALATLVFELLDREDRGDWNRLAISVCPGVSAIQAAASRIGAPIGHDFCTVSLSDLLTPWEAIRSRLEGAAMGGFVVALYNPVSKKRQQHIIEARDILLKHRPAETPVVLARNLGREGENISVIRLDELGPDKADMLTLVLIGNEQTRCISRGTGKWVYTPRGYAAKMDATVDGAA